MNNKKEDIREDFCPSCLIVPLAFAGVSATTAGSVVSKKKHKKMKLALLISGMLTVILSIGMIVYYNMNKKDCKSCKL